MPDLTKGDTYSNSIKTVINDQFYTIGSNLENLKVIINHKLEQAIKTKKETSFINLPVLVSLTLKIECLEWKNENTLCSIDEYLRKLDLHKRNVFTYKGDLSKTLELFDEVEAFINKIVREYKIWGI